MSFAARQRDLFTKRTRKLPVAPEFHTHCMIADLLRLSLAPGWLWFHPANGEYRSIATGARLKRMGVKPGVSDFILIKPPAGLVHALELKRSGEHPTGPQMAFLALVRAAGGQSDWTDSFDGAVAILKRWEAVRVAT
jgi:hypothetical protein